MFTINNKFELQIDEDGGVVLTFDENGGVRVSEPYSEVMWSETRLLPIAYDLDTRMVTASLWLMGYDEGEDTAFGAEVILNIPVSNDGTAKASKISIEKIIPGPNW
jgi:hypothetical protein